MSDDWPVMVVKWHAISLKRLEHFGELRRTGRWRHYFATEDAFEVAFRKASADVEHGSSLPIRVHRLTSDDLSGGQLMTDEMSISTPRPAPLSTERTPTPGWRSMPGDPS